MNRISGWRILVVVLLSCSTVQFVAYRQGASDQFQLLQPVQDLIEDQNIMIQYYWNSRNIYKKRSEHLMAILEAIGERVVNYRENTDMDFRRWEINKDDPDTRAFYATEIYYETLPVIKHIEMELTKYELMRER